MRTFGLVAAMLFGIPLAGCAGSRPVEGLVRLGEVARVNGPKVRPDRVVEDSRCPVDTTCVQAGRLVVQATVFGGGWSKEVDLILGVPVPVADGLLTLIDATPNRLTAARGKRPTARFSFRFQGGL